MHKNYSHHGALLLITPALERVGVQVVSIFVLHVVSYGSKNLIPGICMIMT